MSDHLGDLASALVDNQLSIGEQEQAFSHLARCPHCSQEVAGIQAARALLNSSQDFPVPSQDFFQTLIELGKSDMPDHRALKQQDIPGILQPQTAAPGSAVSAFVEHERVSNQALAGSVTKSQGLKKQWPKYVASLTVGALCAGIYALGDRPTVTPQLSVAATQEHFERTTVAFDFIPVAGINYQTGQGQSSEVDLAKFEEWLEHNQYSGIEGLPDSVSITRAGYSTSNPGVLEIVFATDVGPVILTQTYGQLNLKSVAQLPSIESSSGQIYVVNDLPAHLVWQSGENVNELIAQTSVSDLKGMIGAFHVTGSDSGLKDRIARGFAQLTGVIP